MAEQDTFRTYLGDNVTTDFPVTFPYELPSEVIVQRDGADEAFTFVNASVIRISSPLLTAQALTVQRMTNIDNPAVVWKNGSATTGSQLNAMARQLLNSMQEARDTADRGLFRKPTGEYDFQNSRGANVADPVNPKDAVNKQYADSTIPANVAAAAGSASAAAGSASAAATSAGQAAQKVTDAAAQVTLAAGQVTLAAGQATLASQWAQNDEDVPVTTGQFSAKHWAAKALKAVANMASAISFTPIGNISATNVADALAELDNEKLGNGTDASGSFGVNGAAGTLRTFQAKTSGVLRWTWGANSNAETGSGNTGSYWVLNRYLDNGSLADTPITVDRRNGVVTFSQRPILFGNKTPWDTGNLNTPVDSGSVQALTATQQQQARDNIGLLWKPLQVFEPATTTVSATITVPATAKMVRITGVARYADQSAAAATTLAMTLSTDGTNYITSNSYVIEAYLAGITANTISSTHATSSTYAVMAYPAQNVGVAQMLEFLLTVGDATTAASWIGRAGSYSGSTGYSVQNHGGFLSGGTGGVKKFLLSTAGGISFVAGTSLVIEWR